MSFFSTGGFPGGFLASGFNPQALSVPLSLWLSGRFSNTMLNSGSIATNNQGVDTWNSQVGSGSWTQATSSLQPLLKQNDQNGIAALGFDGVQDSLIGNSSVLGVTQNIATITVVMAIRIRQYNYPGSNTLFSINTGIPNYNSRLSYQSYCYDGQNGNRQIDARALDNDGYSTFQSSQIFPATSQTFTIETVQVNFSTTQARIRRNGITIKDWGVLSSMTPGNTSNTPASSFILGDLAAMDWGELLVFPGILQDYEIFTLEQWLQGLWTPLAKLLPNLGSMTLSEDFNESSLNTALWNTLYPWGARTNAANGELEFYLDANVSLSGGTLSLTAQQQTYYDSGSGNTYNYTSGMVTTYGNFVQTYGYFECRVKLPAGQGLWPAFWMLAENELWPPEIDLFEMLGNDPTTIYCSVHYSDGQTEQSQVQVTGASINTSTGYHVFGLYWLPGLLVYTVDGWEVARYTHGVPATPMYILMALSVGGGWPGSPNGSTAFPAIMSVDYVRAWQFASIPSQNQALDFSQPSNSMYGLVL